MSEIRSIWCAGASESRYAALPEGIHLTWNSPGVGPDGTSSSCSLAESSHSGREYVVDSLGRSDLRFLRHQFDTLSRNVYEGSGTWELRSGLTLTYRSLFADISTRRAIFRQEIELLGTCRIDLAFTDVLADTGWINGVVDAPVICGGNLVGRFTWDRVGSPRVVDSRGDRVLPRMIIPARFSEDTLGLRATVVGLERNLEDSSARLRMEVRMGFLDWDTLAQVDWIHLSMPERRFVDSVPWSGRSVDTLEFRVHLRDLDGLRKPNLPVLYAPFRGYGSTGYASSKPFIP